MPQSAIDHSAVAALRSEIIDWRFKGMPSDAFGWSIEQFLATRPSLTGSGFVGPILTLDAAAMRHNMTAMAEWCGRHGIDLAPHGKTTMAPQLFEAQLEHGAWGITAANHSQLRVYRAFGVARILLANQLVDPPALRWVADELDGDPGFSFGCWVDSVAGVELMNRTLAAHSPRRSLDVLVEIGAEAGRTGVRDLRTAMDVASAVAQSPHLRLVGVAGYEGAVAHGLDDRALATVDAFVATLRSVTSEFVNVGHFDQLDEVIVTCGGSAYFDQVAEGLTAPWPFDIPIRPVLRSGAYITHDDGMYRASSPFGRPHRLSGTETPLRPAMRIWAEVTSQPEPTLALLTMGRRDVSFDQHFPEPQVLRTRDGVVTTITTESCRVTKLADQHAFLDVDSGVPLTVGDWLGFGLSHPCTVFDKWPLIPVVEGDEVVDLVRTFF